jgi:hypothetical protein
MEIQHGPESVLTKLIAATVTALVFYKLFWCKAAAPAFL